MKRKKYTSQRSFLWNKPEKAQKVIYLSWKWQEKEIKDNNCIPFSVDLFTQFVCASLQKSTGVCFFLFIFFIQCQLWRLCSWWEKAKLFILPSRKVILFCTLSVLACKEGTIITSLSFLKHVSKHLTQGKILALTLLDKGSKHKFQKQFFRALYSTVY